MTPRFVASPSGEMAALSARRQAVYRQDGVMPPMRAVTASAFQYGAHVQITMNGGR
jgi:hypothetical protein